MMMDFAGRLKRLRIEKGYSQATLAKKITDAGQKLGEASIAKYENGRTYPNLQTAACMADCFGVSIDYLACGEKAAVVSVDGLTDEQINLMTELTRALRQQNKGRRGNPKSTPTPERQELVFKLVAQFLKSCSDDTAKTGRFHAPGLFCSCARIFAVSPVYWKSLPERDRMWVSQEDAVHPARSHRNAGAQAF